MPQFWGGFVNDRLHTGEVDAGFGGFGLSRVRVPMMFTSKANAQAHYEDVRKVEVRVVSKRNHGKRASSARS
jgi:hypothetical protein